MVSGLVVTVVLLFLLLSYVAHIVKMCALLIGATSTFSTNATALSWKNSNVYNNQLATCGW